MLGLSELFSLNQSYVVISFQFERTTTRDFQLGQNFFINARKGKSLDDEEVMFVSGMRHTWGSSSFERIISTTFSTASMKLGSNVTTQLSSSVSLVSMAGVDATLTKFLSDSQAKRNSNPLSPDVFLRFLDSTISNSAVTRNALNVTDSVTFRALRVRIGGPIKEQLFLTSQSNLKNSPTISIG